jgi:hypothetical protein
VQNSLRLQLADEIADLRLALFVRYRFGASEAASFWKRGSFRSGSNIGSSRSSAGVSGAVVNAPK